MRKLLLLIGVVLPLRAGDRAKETLVAAQKEIFHVAPASAIRLENSFGEVDVDGWDRDETEVTVVRSTERLYTPKQRAGAQKRLDSVRITVRQDGGDVIISTAYPPRRFLLHPLSRRSDIDIAYRIKAPRSSRLIVQHNSGGVNVSGIAGDIHATVTNGQITLTLPVSHRYSIDAQTTIGSVYSDFEGEDRRSGYLGEDFSQRRETPAASLFLRVCVGDILIQKLLQPAD